MTRDDLLAWVHEHDAQLLADLEREAGLTRPEPRLRGGRFRILDQRSRATGAWPAGAYGGGWQNVPAMRGERVA